MTTTTDDNDRAIETRLRTALHEVADGVAVVAPDFAPSAEVGQRPGRTRVVAIAALVVAAIAVPAVAVVATRDRGDRPDTVAPGTGTVPTSTNPTVPPSSGKDVRVTVSVPRRVVASGGRLPVTVTVTNTSATNISVGACLSTFGVYPALIDARTGRVLSGPDSDQTICITMAFGLAPGASRSYDSFARAVTSVPMTSREQPLPPGHYRLALRRLYNATVEHGLDRLPPVDITVVAP
jgi:hypothetical protein